MGAHKHCFECKGCYGHHYPSCSSYVVMKGTQGLTDDELCELIEIKDKRIAELETQLAEANDKLARLSEVRDIQEGRMEARIAELEAELESGRHIMHHICQLQEAKLTDQGKALLYSMIRKGKAWIEQTKASEVSE